MKIIRWRTGLVFVVLGVVALAAAGAGPAGSVGLPPAPPGTRAMWLWSNPPAAEVIEWSASREITELFVSVEPDVATNGTLPNLRELKRLTDARGIRLAALGGDKAWATDHAGALAWQRAVQQTGLFATLHIDVEPYLLPGWNTNRNTTMSKFLTMLDKMRAAASLPIEADVPFWYGEYTVNGRNLASEVLKRVAAVTVMSYRDTGTGPNSILEVSRDWLARGAAAGKRVRLGAETGALSDCPYCTFAEEGATQLGNELAKVDAATRTTYAFAGIAVHHYDSWRQLPS